MTDFNVPPRGTTATPSTANGTTGSTGLNSQVEDGIANAKEAAAPYVEKARGFAKSRPWAAAALAGVVGLAVLNTIRGKR